MTRPQVACVTGSSGFIGQHLVRTLEKAGWNVHGYDFRKGRALGDQLALVEWLDDCNPDVVFHLAAHANVRRGAENPLLDYEVNTHGTFNLLEAMRRTGHTRLVFASSCSVYGEPRIFPTREDAPFPIQTSLYGASKVAGEAMIQAYNSTFGFDGTILRLCSQLGPGLVRGHIVDLWKQLKKHPEWVKVLGDGYQNKSYLHVEDCMKAFVDTLPYHHDIFNVAGPCWTVRESLAVICDEMNVAPVEMFGSEMRGWVGDSPHINPSTDRLQALTGWKPTRTIEQAVRDSVRWLEGQR
jgi:UDP-glucose 4-epimerase